jgi:hypothetical protein
MISTEAFDRLKALGLVSSDIHDLRTRARRCVLRNLRIQGQSVPDVEMRVRSDALFRRTDGYLGQDFFFGMFAEVCFKTRIHEMTLRAGP